jgi:hypothetical protein
MLLASGSQVADDPHSRIHQGKMYHVSHKLASVADDGTLTFALTTPADDWPHVAPTGAAEGAFDFEIFEGASITGGTSLTAQNHLRGSSNTFGGSIVHTPTVNDAGTRLLFRSSGGSGAFGILSSPGLASFNYEWVLLAETTYLFRITNRSGGAVDMSMAINFYSAPDLN